LIFPSISIDNIQVYLIALALFSCMVVPIGIVWTMFGAALTSGRLKFVTRIKLQRATALIIGVFSASVAWAIFH